MVIKAEAQTEPSSFRDSRQVGHNGYTDGWSDAQESRRMPLGTEKADRQFAGHGYRGQGEAPLLLDLGIRRRVQVPTEGEEGAVPWPVREPLPAGLQGVGEGAGDLNDFVCRQGGSDDS